MSTCREWTSIAKKVLGFAVFAAVAGTGPITFMDRAGAEEAAAPSPNSPDEPVAKTLSLKKAAQFLDAVSQNWTETRQCGTCHTNYAYLIARPSLREIDSAAIPEIRAFFEDRVENWDGPEKSDKPRWDTEVVATASALALNDAATTGKLHPSTRKALDRMWGLQKPDGSWDWLKCNWPPYEHDDYYGVAFAALGVGAAPDGYAASDSAKAGLERLRSYLKATPPPDLHHKTILLWASTKLDGLMDPTARSQTIDELRSLQRADGGWNLPSLGTWKRHGGSPNDKDAPSDGYATGLVVYVLRQAGVPARDEAIQRGVDWLKSHQRESGRWFTRSLSNDKYHYIANAGTGFAVLALKACDVEE